ncbi:hypothetical protein [Peribacillus sp. SCS-37]|uniref:hypothetical protein n=1 Tax=Paraperibacillus esterisolvens TaxID=3115296 RepID=UPI003905E72C
MSFDAGIHFDNTAFVLGVGAYPVAFLTCSILAWVFCIRSKRKAVIITFIPFLWIAGFGLLLIFS